MKMTAEQYIAERVDDQIAWYERRSGSNKRMHRGLMMVQFTAAALIPLLTVWQPAAKGDVGWPRLVIAALGVAMAIGAAAMGLYRFHELWVEYRMTCEALRREKFFFLTSCDPYGDDEATNLDLLVQRVEELLSKEKANWNAFMKRPVPAPNAKRGSS